MKWLLLFFLSLEPLVVWEEGDPYTLVQNKPVTVGTRVTFTITTNSSEIPYVAWDFGDGKGLGAYKRSLAISYIFEQPGVYQIFARIQGEEIPVSTVQTVYKPVQNPRPTHSSTIVFDASTNKLWVANADNNSVSCLNALTYQLIKEIPTGTHPRTVAVDKNGNAWSANEDDATLTIVSATGGVWKNIKLPYASRPYGVCFDPLKNFCYVTLQGTGRLAKINADTQEVIEYAEVGRSPRGIAISSDGKTAYVTQFISPDNQGVVRAINTVSMEVEKEIPIAYDQAADFEDRGRGVPNYLSSISITPDGSQAWVPSKKDNTARGMFRDGQPLTFDNTVRTIASKIDLSAKSENLDLRVDINDADMANAVEFSPYGNIAFVALQGNNKISMLEVASNARLGTLDSTGLAPQGLVMTPDGSRLFVHNFMSRTVKVYNTEDIVLSNNQTAAVLATIPTVVSERLSPQVLKGKQIFYNAQDERMTFAGYISCASCHLDGGSDERIWDFTDRGEGLRNTHSLLGKAGIRMGNVHWTSNFDEIQDFENDMRNAFMGKGFLPDSIFNKGAVSDPLGTPKNGLSPELDALAAYVASLDKVHPSPWRNEDGSLTEDALQGKKLFATVGCNTCHAGDDFTDRKMGSFHDVGTIQTSSGKRRNGALSGFGTPTLKGIWETAPYLHDGSAATLHDVLVTRNVNKKHGDLGALTATQIDQLIAYLLQIDESESPTNSTDLPSLLSTLNSELKVTPNPATNRVAISLKGFGVSPGTLVLYQAASAVPLAIVHTHGEEVVELDLSPHSKGLCVVKYRNDHQEKSAKLIVK